MTSWNQNLMIYFMSNAFFTPQTWFPLRNPPALGDDGSAINWGHREEFCEKKPRCSPQAVACYLSRHWISLARTLRRSPLIDRSSIADSRVWFPWFSKLGFFKAVYYLTHRGLVSAFHTHTLFNVKFVSALYHFCFALTFLRTCLLVLLYSAPIISLPEVSGAQGRYIHKLVCTSYAHRPPEVDIGIHPCVIWMLFLCCLEPPAIHLDRGYRVGLVNIYLAHQILLGMILAASWTHW